VTSSILKPGIFGEKEKKGPSDEPLNGRSNWSVLVYRSGSGYRSKLKSEPVGCMQTIIFLALSFKQNTRVGLQESKACVSGCGCW